MCAKEDSDVKVALRAYKERTGKESYDTFVLKFCCFILETRICFDESKVIDNPERRKSCL